MKQLHAWQISFVRRKRAGALAGIGCFGGRSSSARACYMSQPYCSIKRNDLMCMISVVEHWAESAMSVVAWTKEPQPEENTAEFRSGAGLDVDLLRTLVAIADTGSFNRAARAVFRTPS